MTSSVVQADEVTRSSSVGRAENIRQGAPRRIHHYNTFNGPFFWTTSSPRRQYFIIHPEWASENIVPATWMTGQQRQETAVSGSGSLRRLSVGLGRGQLQGLVVDVAVLRPACAVATQSPGRTGDSPSCAPEPQRQGGE